MALNFDDIERSFGMAVSVLELALPGLVKRKFVASWSPLTDADKDFINSGGIIIDVAHCKVHGIFVGQDALHIYFRIVERIDWNSRDAAWALRCARKLLRSWNYAPRCFGRMCEVLTYIYT